MKIPIKGDSHTTGGEELANEAGGRAVEPQRTAFSAGPGGRR